LTHTHTHIYEWLFFEKTTKWDTILEPCLKTLQKSTFYHQNQCKKKWLLSHTKSWVMTLVCDNYQMSNYNFCALNVTINITYCTLKWMRPQGLPHTSVTTICVIKPTFSCCVKLGLHLRLAGCIVLTRAHRAVIFENSLFC